MNTSTLTIDVADEIERIRDVLDAFEATLDADDEALFEARPGVSDWSPAQHLYHVCGATAMMLKAATVLAAGAVEGEPASLSEDGRSILTSRTIPRGVAQAPSRTQPPDDLGRDALRDSLKRCRAKLTSAEQAVQADVPTDRGLEHPAWGTLTAPQWLRAAAIHTQHHLDIVDDVQGRKA